jgi:hypothetical protein
MRKYCWNTQLPVSWKTRWKEIGSPGINAMMRCLWLANRIRSSLRPILYKLFSLILIISSLDKMIIVLRIQLPINNIISHFTSHNLPRKQLQSTVHLIILHDYPLKYQSLLPQLFQLLRSPLHPMGLTILKQIFKLYETAINSERLPIYAMINFSFPILEQIFRQIW